MKKLYEKYLGEAPNVGVDDKVEKKHYQEKMKGLNIYIKRRLQELNALQKVGDRGGYFKILSYMKTEITRVQNNWLL